MADGADGKLQASAADGKSEASGAEEELEFPGFDGDFEALEKGFKAAAEATEKERAPEEGDEKTEEAMELERMMQSGVFNLRCRWGLRFSRAIDGGLSKEYKAAQTRSEKAAFKQDWAKAQFERITVRREKSQSFQRVDIKHGVYRPFGALYQRQGGKDDPLAWQAAKNIADACVKMGPPWTRYNEMSKRTEFLDMEYSHRSEFSKAWRLYELREQSEGGNQGEKKGDAEKGTGKGDEEKGKGDEEEGKPKQGKGRKDKKGQMTARNRWRRRA